MTKAIAALLSFAFVVAALAQSGQAPAPIAVRNERPRAGQEVLVLRHQQLKKGEHDAYYRASRAGVWPCEKSLESGNAPTRPLYMPGLAERYERVDGAPSANDDVIAVRTAGARPGREIVERYQRIAKGAFDRFVGDTRVAVWPFEEKLGARPIGLLAMTPDRAVLLGGNGPDWRAPIFAPALAERYRPAR